MANTDQDGNGIRREEITRYAIPKAKLMELIGLDPDKVKVMYVSGLSLDADGAGELIVEVRGR